MSKGHFLSSFLLLLVLKLTKQHNKTEQHCFVWEYRSSAVWNLETCIQKNQMCITLEKIRLILKAESSEWQWEQRMSENSLYFFCSFLEVTYQEGEMGRKYLQNSEQTEEKRLSSDYKHTVWSIGSCICLGYAQCCDLKSLPFLSLPVCSVPLCHPKLNGRKSGKRPVCCFAFIYHPVQRVSIPTGVSEYCCNTSSALLFYVPESICV